MNVVQVNYAFDQKLSDPEALLDRYSTLTGWSEAVAGAGAGSVAVIQRFHCDAVIRRHGIDYVFKRGRLHRQADRLSPDVVHVNGLVFPIQTWVLRQTMPASCAIVVQDHGGGEPSAGLIGERTVLHRRLAAADGFLFAARGQADAWRRVGAVGPHQQIYEVMEASTTFRAWPRAQACQTSGVDGSPAILWVGRLNANKDPLTVLAGFERSLNRLPRARLTMVYGDAELLPAVERRLRSSPVLGEAVRLVGAVPHDRMPAFYSAADIFVLGSHHESCGYALIEACACGVVPVVTDIPAFRAITADGSIGALWHAGDPAGFARALEDVWNRDPAALGAQAAQHFEQALSWPAVGAQALTAYQDAAARRRTGAAARSSA
jgi:glycosyltransferase involved in cell wall biosynthesis